MTPICFVLWPRRIRISVSILIQTAMVYLMRWKRPRFQGSDSKVSSAPDVAADHASESNPVENNLCRSRAGLRCRASVGQDFQGMATFVLFAMTSYKLRPASISPNPIKDDDKLAEDGKVLIGSILIGETMMSCKIKKRALLDDDNDESNDAEGMVFFPTSRT